MLKKIVLGWLLGMCFAATPAFAGAESIYGSWQLTLKGAPDNNPVRYMISFERDGILHVAQANAFRSMAFGHWMKKRNGIKFQDSHYIYDEHAPYAINAIETHYVDMQAKKDGLEGTGRVEIKDLDGNVISSIVVDVVGKKLPQPTF